LSALAYIRGKSAGQKTGGRKRIEKTVPLDTSDKALASLLERLKKTVDPDEVRQLSDQSERIVFHKQFANA
jgi:hypothetical protein